MLCIQYYDHTHAKSETTQTLFQTWKEDDEKKKKKMK